MPSAERALARASKRVSALAGGQLTGQFDDPKAPVTFSWLPNSIAVACCKDGVYRVSPAHQFAESLRVVEPHRLLEKVLRKIPSAAADGGFEWAGLLFLMPDDDTSAALIKDIGVTAANSKSDLFIFDPVYYKAKVREKTL